MHSALVDLLIEKGMITEEEYEKRIKTESEDKLNYADFFVCFAVFLGVSEITIPRFRSIQYFTNGSSAFCLENWSISS